MSDWSFINKAGQPVHPVPSVRRPHWLTVFCLISGVDSPASLGLIARCECAPVSHRRARPDEGQHRNRPSPHPVSADAAGTPWNIESPGRSGDAGEDDGSLSPLTALSDGDVRLLAGARALTVEGDLTAAERWFEEAYQAAESIGDLRTMAAAALGWADSG